MIPVNRGQHSGEGGQHLPSTAHGDTSAWYAVLAPARTPRPVIDMLNAELNKAFADPAFRDQFAAQGVQFVGGSADDLGAFMRNETKRWGEVIESTGMKAQ